MPFKRILLIFLIANSVLFAQEIKSIKLKPVLPNSETNIDVQQPQLRPMVNDPNAIVPDSIWVKGRTIDFFAEKAKTSDKAIGGDISLGYGMYNQNISNYFSNPVLVGINIDLHNKRRILQFGGMLGIGMSTANMEFPDETVWEKDNAFIMANLGASIGYSIVDNRNFLIAPVAGVAIGIHTAVFMNSEAENNEPFLPFYKVGFIYDIKPLALLQDRQRLNGRDINYTSLRMSAGVYLPIGRPKHGQFFYGNMVYITIGMGGLSRDYSKY